MAVFVAKSDRDPRWIGRNRLGKAFAGANVPRDEHGRWAFDGGRKKPAKKPKPKVELNPYDNPEQFYSEEGVVRGPDYEQWGATHEGSQIITGQSAKDMKIAGYRDMKADDFQKSVAFRFLHEIGKGDTSAGEPIYHGFSNTAGIDWKAGDTMKLPLVATSGNFAASANYGAKKNPTVFEFDKGTKIAGYARWNASEAKKRGFQWDEAITAGEFEVTGVTEKGDVKVVKLKQSSVFDPTSRKWK